MKIVAALFVLVTGIGLSSSAAAQDPADSPTTSDSAASPDAPPPAPKPPAAKTIPMAPAGAWYTDAILGGSSQPFGMLGLGWFPARDFTIYGAFGFTYNPNGSVADAFGVKGGTSDRFAADAIFAAAYFVVDRFPFAAGPELALGGSLAPGLTYYNSFVEPAIALRYAPFTAANGHVGPLIVGTDLGVQFLFVGSPGGAYKNPTVSSVATGLHLIFPL